MKTLAELNRIAASQATNFRLASYDGHRLLLVGSFDLSYYHDVEVAFIDVCRINCPIYFHGPQFTASGLCTCCDGQRFAIRTDDGEYEIVAQAVETTIGKVYYYDRGPELQPGERIADWVKRTR